MDKQVPHICDCQHCTVKYDTVTVSEGPITESAHKQNQMFRTIWGAQIKAQLEDNAKFAEHLRRKP